MSVKVDLQLNKDDGLFEVVVKNGRRIKTVACSTDANAMGSIAKFLIEAFSDVYIESQKESYNRTIKMLTEKVSGTNKLSK